MLIPIKKPDTDISVNIIYVYIIIQWQYYVFVLVQYQSKVWTYLSIGVYKLLIGTVYRKHSISRIIKLLCDKDV